MDKKSIISAQKKVKDFFAGELEKFGVSHEATNWGSRKSQYARFDVLTAIGEINDKKILDVGCGLGEMYKYLKDKRKKVNYTGLDLCDEMIASAKTRFSRSPNAKFKTADILEMSISQKYDYVLASGTFNLNLKNNEKLIRDVITRMYEMSKIGAGISMLSAHADFTEKFYYYYDPADIFKFCLTLCRKVVIRHDYMPHDFTIFMYK